MKIGTVTGAVWSSRKASCLMGQTFLTVATPEGQKEFEEWKAQRAKEAEQHKSV